jgi:hypothetical protein
MTLIRSAVCEMSCDRDQMRLLFEGSQGIREQLQRTLQNLSKPRTLRIQPPSFFSPRSWAFTLETSHAADVVADSLLGIFQDGFELYRDWSFRCFSFWSLEEKAKTASEGQHL